ncbi:hypothetical protein LTS15_010541 [Exophiala xenobiotica]|nr:hypothetical protein LTS15_010541 [Exophiala xenobiotica]
MSLCLHNNPSYSTQCGKCRGLVLPTRDQDNNRLTWTFYAFGSAAPPTMRTSAFFFNDALASLNNVERMAIFIGDENQQALLVQAPARPRQYTIQRIQDKSVNNWYGTTTRHLNQNQVLFHQVVREILDVDDFVSATMSWHEI